MNQLNGGDVVLWLRSTSDRFQEMANEIEAIVNLVPSSSTGEQLNDRVFRLLSDGTSRRPVEIAESLDASWHAVREIIGNDPRFETNDRGWASVCSTEGTKAATEAVEAPDRGTVGGNH